MKKLCLILLAMVLMCLSFTSCIFDDDVIGKVNIESYILIPKEYDILYPYEEDNNNVEVSKVRRVLKLLQNSP